MMMGLFHYLREVFVRVGTHAQLHHRWFGTDKPAREAMGYREGLYPQSYADQERLGLRRPDELNPCATELRSRWGR